MKGFYFVAAALIAASAHASSGDVDFEIKAPKMGKGRPDVPLGKSVGSGSGEEDDATDGSGSAQLFKLGGNVNAKVGKVGKVALKVAKVEVQANAASKSAKSSKAEKLTKSAKSAKSAKVAKSAQASRYANKSVLKRTRTTVAVVAMGALVALAVFAAVLAQVRSRENNPSIYVEEDASLIHNTKTMYAYNGLLE